MKDFMLENPSIIYGLGEFALKEIALFENDKIRIGIKLTLSKRFKRNKNEYTN